MQHLEIAESVDIKISKKIQAEHFQSWADQQPKNIHKGIPFDPRNNILAVLSRPELKSPTKGTYEIIKRFVRGANIVTDSGDIYYAKKACGESPAANENFLTGRMELRTGAATPAKTDTYTNVTTPTTGSRKTYTSTYPKTNDGDADNSAGAGIDIATYLTSWLTTDFNQTAIIGGCIHDNATPSGATKLLTHWSIASFDKTASDTLKLFVNHTMNGV